ncbi:hypothetical protein FRC12_019409 [Ceratobasidium sp. 428]|nr:hypothetical protein FRC12_019409 [Ceratobasidium sp. 428]
MSEDFGDTWESKAPRGVWGRSSQVASSSDIHFSLSVAPDLGLGLEPGDRLLNAPIVGKECNPDDAETDPNLDEGRLLVSLKLRGSGQSSFAANVTSFSTLARRARLGDLSSK